MASPDKTTTPLIKVPKQAPVDLPENIMPQKLFGNNLNQVPGMKKRMADQKNVLMQPLLYIGMPVKIPLGFHRRPLIIQDFFIRPFVFHPIPANPYLICLPRAPKIPKSGIQGVIKKSEKPMIIRNLFKIIRFSRLVR